MPKPGKLRLIAGKWRGRQLDILDAPGLRPSPDRVRETLFNWIQLEIVGARCLDLFAVTGAFGFESLSRGATEVVMIESNPKLVEALKQSAELLACENHTIQLTDAMSWLKQGSKGFDIIFLDPPFGEGYVEQCCRLIREQALLNDKGLLYIESEPGLDLPEGWNIKKQLKAGQVQSLLLEQN